jgi:hypothetical protein
MSATFAGTITGPDNAAMLVKTSASTSACEANLDGYTVHSDARV